MGTDRQAELFGRIERAAPSLLELRGRRDRLLAGIKAKAEKDTFFLEAPELCDQVQCRLADDIRNLGDLGREIARAERRALEGLRQ